jgi:hypothetical protein
MKRFHLLLAATCCVSLRAIPAESRCLPIVCPPPPPTLWIWGDGLPPCSTTLQNCIDQAASGDVVEIHTDGPIGESISFQKSLTLEAAQGYRPMFAGTQTIEATSDSTGSNLIHIEGLTLQQGHILVSQNSTGQLTAQIIGNTIESSLASDSPIEVFPKTSGLGAIAFDVSGNTIEVNSPGSNGILIDSRDGNATGQVKSNSIMMQGSQLGGAIFLQARAASSNVDVVANRISGTGYTYGIIVSPYTTSVLTKARIVDNLVTGQATSGAPAGAISLDPYFTGGTLLAFVVNNTVAGNDEGIVVTVSGQSGATINGLVANNIVSDTTEVGIAIDSSFAATVPNQSNLVFANGTDFLGTAPGPGTLSTNPLFVGAADYHLQAASPGIDKGDDSAVPMDLLTDLDGNPRIRGSHVDIGAYEAAPEPDPQMLAVSALAALVGFVSLRRPTHRD